MPSQYNPDKHNRRSMRIKGYDYTQPGSYFVTICTHQRQHVFGDIVDGVMLLNSLGHRVHQYWGDIPNHFPYAALDEYVVMPNHVHGIITITSWNRPNVPGARHAVPLEQTTVPLKHAVPLDGTGVDNKTYVAAKPIEQFGKPIPHSLPTMVRSFKSACTKWARENTHSYIIWQRNYHVRIIRNEHALQRTRQYIIHNPLKWEMDTFCSTEEIYP